MNSPDPATTALSPAELAIAGGRRRRWLAVACLTGFGVSGIAASWWLYPLLCPPGSPWDCTDDAGLGSAAEVVGSLAYLGLIAIVAAAIITVRGLRADRADRASDHLNA